MTENIQCGFHSLFHIPFTLRHTLRKSGISIFINQEEIRLRYNRPEFVTATVKTLNNNNSIQFNSILYFNVLTQQLQEPITESAQEDEIYT
jgi:hypothetical protein